jgi:mRNA interferase MazF
MVILSSGGEGDLLAIYVVPPADQDITGVALELAIGGEPSGVVRVGLPGPGRIPCSWLVSLKKDDLIEQAGTLPEEKLAQLGEMLHLGGLER